MLALRTVQNGLLHRFRRVLYPFQQKNGISSHQKQSSASECVFISSFGQSLCVAMCMTEYLLTIRICEGNAAKTTSTPTICCSAAQDAVACSCHWIRASSVHPNTSCISEHHSELLSVTKVALGRERHLPMLHVKQGAPNVSFFDFHRFCNVVVFRAKSHSRIQRECYADNLSNQQQNIWNVILYIVISIGQAFRSRRSHAPKGQAASWSGTTTTTGWGPTYRGKPSSIWYHKCVLTRYRTKATKHNRRRYAGLTRSR